MFACFIIFPCALVLQFRLAVFAVYGLFSAGWLLGLWGVTLLMLHLSISLVVAQLRSPALSWFCSLLLLSTLNVSALQDLQVCDVCAPVIAVIHECKTPKFLLL